MKTGYALNIAPEELGIQLPKREYIEQHHYSPDLSYAHLVDINKSRDARVFVELPACQSHVDVWVDALLMKEIVKNFCSKEFDINIDVENGVLEIPWMRYTMNPNGFHIGYETWVAKFPIREKRMLESNKMILEALVGTGNCTWYNCCVLLSEMEVACIDSPETETCECDNPDECNCELYISPIDDNDFDFGYQEADAMIVDVVKNTQACWKFGGYEHGWQMWVNGKMLWEVGKKNEQR